MSEVPKRKARRQPRAVAAAAAANADSDSPSVSFQSPRKRSMKAGSAGRKKARSTDKAEDKPSSTTVVSSDITAHRYPLRSRSTRSTFKTDSANRKMTKPHERSEASSSSSPVLPQAVTPASAAPRPRQLQFGDEPSDIPSLFAEGTPTCRCPRLCNFQTLTGFEYLKHYGEDVLQYLDDKESKEHRALPLSHSSTRQQGCCHDSSTLSSPASCKYNEEETSCAPSPSASTDSGSTVSGPVTPRPDSVISTKARIRNGDKNMRFLEEPAEKLERQPHVNQRMRAVLVSWLIEVSIEYNCSMAAYHLAISLLDKVLDCGPTSGERISWLSYDSDSDDEPDWPEKWFVVSRSEFQALGWYVLLCLLFIVRLFCFCTCFSLCLCFFVYSALVSGWPRKWRIGILH